MKSSNHPASAPGVGPRPPSATAREQQMPAGPGPGRGLNLNWFRSRQVRLATHMRKHVRRMLNAQRDLLSPEAIDSVSAALERIHAACRGRLDPPQLESEMTHLEEVANRWLRPYPHAAMRENVEVLLVAIAIAMGIRTFVAQPFKIPTGSMQPTLYGVTSEPDFTKFGESGETNFEVPNPLKAFILYWVTGIGYDHVVAKEDGVMQTTLDEPSRFLLFQVRQTFRVGRRSYTVWFPPDKLLQRAGLVNGRGEANPRVFRAGEDILKMKSYSGDHLFVDRMTYNFRRPQRGEIVVFETAGIPGLSGAAGQFYIKRLIALGGERVRIGDDRHVYINGEALTANTPHFERVYSFNPADRPRESRYSGHVNGSVSGSNYFPDEQTTYTVPAGQYMVMGDNTMNSSDSRSWGPFPRENVIGRSLCVYWPFGSMDDRKSRFGRRSR